MKRTLIIGAAFALSLAAQENKEVQVFTKTVEAGHAAGVPAAGVHFIASEMSWEEKIVKGQPYAADAVTETTQTLADGNRITRKQTAQIYRDGEGRTRREQSIDAIGPWSSGQGFKTIFINDPVARVNWILDPQEKTARKMPLPPANAAEPQVEFIDKIKVEGSLIGGFGAARVAAPLPPPPPPDLHTEVGVDVAHGRLHYVTPTQNQQSASLGKQVIEGVECEGTRTTVTIAAGEIGNDRPIEIVAEKWVSPELGITVLSKRSDPRVGENVYRLTNLRRGEPGRSLFEPSAEYKVEIGMDKLFMHKRDKSPNDE